MRFNKVAYWFLVVWTIFNCCSAYAVAEVRGIYIMQQTMQNTAYINYLITKSKEVGINTFVIDFERMKPYYQKSLQLIKQNGIRYVARIVVFPDGGNNSNVLSQAYWEKKYKLVEQAVDLGADAIQLDYIRYASSQPASAKNAQNIYKVIRWFKDRLDELGVPLEIDVFGISTFGASQYIGQNLTLFADSVDAVCPMVYPSHYEPYLKYAKMPYLAVYLSIKALRRQFMGNVPFKVYPFIEVYNYRYPMSQKEKLQYIASQLMALRDTMVDGFYVWNIHNNYDNLFLVLKNQSN